MASAKQQAEVLELEEAANALSQCSDLLECSDLSPRFEECGYRGVTWCYMQLLRWEVKLPQWKNATVALPPCTSSLPENRPLGRQ